MNHDNKLYRFVIRFMNRTAIYICTFYILLWHCVYKEDGRWIMKIKAFAIGKLV